MILSKINDPKWLSEVELIDAQNESVDELKEENINKYFTNIYSDGMFETIKKGIIQNLENDLNDSATWFLSQMPALYMATTSPTEKMEHLTQLVTGKVRSKQQTTESLSPDTQTRSLISYGLESSGVPKIASAIGKTHAKIVRLFNTLDKTTTLCQLYESANKPIVQNSLNDSTKKKLESLRSLLNEQNPKNVETYIENLDEDYLKMATIKQLLIGFEAISYCQNNEKSYVNFTNIVSGENNFRIRIDIGLKAFSLGKSVEQIIGIFTRYRFHVRRILGEEIFYKNENRNYVVISLVVATHDGSPITHDLEAWGRVLKSLKTLTFVDQDDEFTSCLNQEPSFSINETNLIRAIANWTHIFLTKENPYYFSLDRVSATILKHQRYMQTAIKYFRARLDPRFQGERAAESQRLLAECMASFADLTDDVERKILIQGVSFITHILKTNYFRVSKSGLAFRLDPKVLDPQYYPELPYGIFYVIGRNFRGFQVRYRDIARGGVRVVLPRTSADYESALAGIFDEVNGLAYAQQLKNKDIPEGGSKCVIVVNPTGNKNEAVKAAVSGLLDLIVTDEETGKLSDEIIDYYGKPEIIYLGPDENLTDDLILWIIDYALHRGYQYAYAFMSSKPDFGINHKTYGVTSEGLNVYLDNVLENLNLKGKPFRVKMTGGPDGDVAGNELKILFREYGKNARVVAIADGFGCAHDPLGLDWTELLRLVKESKSIVEFDKNKLSQSQQAFVIAADTKENMKVRDSLYAVTEAEVFIPAGGRPYTVKESNWQNYLLKDGRPSSLAIVEGANIFFTKEARQYLVDQGVVVIKDSSANKAGVCTSSYEIIACLTISPSEFSEIKDVYVKQVLQIIRLKADNEAKLLFRELEKRKGETDLVKLSYEISAEINQGKDILMSWLEDLPQEEFDTPLFHRIIFQHCPPILVEKYSERILSRLPRAHKIAIIAAYMASNLIYKEGLNWLEELDPEKIVKIALEYVEAENKVEKMISEIQASDLPFKDQIVCIIRNSGAKYLSSLNV